MRLALLTVSASLAIATPSVAQTFSRPVACDACIANWYYFDRNGDAAGREDWNCGTSSYDGHRGTDFSLAGGNGAIGAGHDIVAVADGTVVSTQDGFYDQCTTCNASVDSRCGTGFGFGYGNHVVINHGSYRVVYAHMRNGSVNVAPGATVSCGDVIGEIGSSGCTTGAHLHFEPRPLGGTSTTAFDPFAGPCSATSPTRWTGQGPYRGLPDRACGTPTPTCPSGTHPIWTCNAERTQRRRCIDGDDMIEACPYGCVSMPVGTDDVCAPPPDADGDGARADVDCDDGDASRYPGAIETCGDGVDQDCDGSDLACPGTDAGPPRDAGSIVPSLDAGGPLVDAGPRRDAGIRPRVDAAIPTSDASAAVDAGDDGEGGLRGGCSCRAGGERAGHGPVALFGLLALAWWRRTLRLARRAHAPRDPGR